MTVEQTKGLLMRAILAALFKPDTIKDREQFIADCDELLDKI